MGVHSMLCSRHIWLTRHLLGCLWKGDLQEGWLAAGVRPIHTKGATLAVTLPAVLLITAILMVLFFMQVTP